MKKVWVIFLLSVLGTGCERSSGQATNPKPSFGQALEQSFSSSPQEKQSRALAEEQRQKLQSSQERLQQERLRSYQVEAGSSQNPE